MARLKGKKLWQTIGSVALAVVTFVGVAVGISALVKKADEDMKVINLKYEIGGLSADGKYEENDGSIYTKESFECQGLTVKPEFDSAVSYQIFFYDSLGEFLYATEEMTGAYNGKILNLVTSARIQIMPDWSFLGITNTKEQVIKWYEISKYANQLEISVLKDQSVEKSANVVDWQVGKFYDGTVTLPTETPSSGDKYAVSQIFTEETLPVGSYIEVSEGYLMRPVIWGDKDTLSSGYETKLTGETVLKITEEFWAKGTICCFNIELVEGSMTEQKANNGFKLYVNV